MLFRAISSIILLMLWGLFDKIVTTAAPMWSAELSVKQLENSDSAYVTSTVGMSYLSSLHLPSVILLVLLVAIWWAPLRKLWSNSGMPVAAALLSLGIANHAFAYCDTKDNAEYVEIEANQTAFVIPEVGANKDSQGKFGSEGYYNENKVPAKRIQVPHTTLRMAGWSSDYYIPASKVIVVDRTPYYQEWVASTTRGTSSKDESFHFESNESVNISTGIVISATVKEEDAAKFLYWFGTKSQPYTPTGDASKDCQMQFQSVLNGRTLSEVMASNVRGEIQAILAREYGSRSTDDDIKSKAAIMKIVNDETKDMFAAKGITIDYIGYAESLTFDQPIQDAINRTYVAHKDADRAATLATALPNLQSAAQVELVNSIAQAFANKWNGNLQLPSVIVGGDMASMISKLVPPITSKGQ